MSFVTLEGGSKIFWREAGAAQGDAPMLLVHGAGGSSATWLDVMHRMSSHRRVIAIDLPGHGKSDGGGKSIDEFRDAVGAVAASLCLGPSILIGHSMGGLIAIAAALAWPDKIAGLGLVTTGARIRVSPVLLANIADRWAQWPELTAETAYSPETPADVRKAGAAVAMAASQAQTDADFRACAAVDYRPVIRNITAPTVVVTGAHDILTPAKFGEALAAGIPGARLVGLARCGHMAMQEQPDRLAAALLSIAAPAPAAIA